MKLILKEYISSLKEEEELEGLMLDLLREMNIKALSIPQKGRQHGVDLLATGTDPDDKKEKLFLFALKQGDIGRTEWNTKVNSVKQTIDEIRDTFITTKLTPTQERLPKKVIVCNNGYINQNVQDDWTAYVKKYSKSDGIEIDSWNIETLIFLVEKYLIDQKILAKDDQALLSKTLAFLDTDDYDFRHLDELLDKILNSPEKKTNKNLIKRIRTINLVQAIIFFWSGEDNNLKPAVIASEKALLKTWHWILKNEYTSSGKIMEEYGQVLIQKAKTDIHYINKIVNHIQTPHALSRYTAMNHVEYSLITWECIGFISCAAALQLNLSLSYPENSDMFKQCNNNFKGLTEHLTSLISNNPSSNYVYLDEHVIEYTLASFVLLLGNHKFLQSWSEEIQKTIIDNYKIKKTFPQFYTNYEALLKDQVTVNENFDNSSTFLTTLADVFTMLQDNEGYSLLHRACGGGGVFEDINLQTWYPDQDSEKNFFDSNVLRDTGITVTTRGLPADMKDYIKEVKMEKDSLLAEGGIEYKKLGTLPLWFFACRHYRNSIPPDILRQFIGITLDKN